MPVPADLLATLDTYGNYGTPHCSNPSIPCLLSVNGFPPLVFRFISGAFPLRTPSFLTQYTESQVSSGASRGVLAVDLVGRRCKVKLPLLPGEGGAPVLWS